MSDTPQQYIPEAHTAISPEIDQQDTRIPSKCDARTPSTLNDDYRDAHTPSTQSNDTRSANTPQHDDLNLPMPSTRRTETIADLDAEGGKETLRGAGNAKFPSISGAHTAATPHDTAPTKPGVRSGDDLPHSELGGEGWQFFSVTSPPACPSVSCLGCALCQRCDCSKVTL